MLHKNIKLAISILLLATAVWQFTERNIGNGIFLILIALIVILFYFKNEILIMTLFKLRKQDMEGAKKLLSKIKNPDGALLRKQNGYFNYLNGIVVSQDNLTLAEKYFKRAVELGLNQNADMAVTKLQLAGIAFSKNKQAEGAKLMAEAEALDDKNMLKDQILMMKNQLKQVKGQKVPMGYNHSKKRSF